MVASILFYFSHLVELGGGRVFVVCIGLQLLMSQCNTLDDSAAECSERLMTDGKKDIGTIKRCFAGLKRE